jgi:hypothetical protein
VFETVVRVRFVSPTYSGPGSRWRAWMTYEGKRRQLTVPVNHALNMEDDAVEAARQLIDRVGGQIVKATERDRPVGDRTRRYLVRWIVCEDTSAALKDLSYAEIEAVMELSALLLPGAPSPVMAYEARMFLTNFGLDAVREVVWRAARGGGQALDVKERADRLIRQYGVVVTL